MSDQLISGLYAGTATLVVAVISGYVVLSGKRMDISARRDELERQEHKEALDTLRKERDEARTKAETLKEKLDEKQHELDRALAEIAVYYAASGISRAASAAQGHSVQP